MGCGYYVYPHAKRLGVSGRGDGLVLAQDRGLGHGTHMRAEFVTSAMQLAIAQRRPEPGLIAHSDRGSQYAGAAYQALLTRNGMRCSMSRKGNCWDSQLWSASS